LDQKIIEIKDELVRMRKDFHRFLELGFKEYWTAEKAAGYMKNLGREVQTGIGGTGVVKLL
jgi:amidohydrolase